MRSGIVKGVGSFRPIALGLTCIFLTVLLVWRRPADRPLTGTATASGVTFSRVDGPGDVVRIDVGGPRTSRITATVFGQDLAFAFDDRRSAWIALAGVDLDTRAGHLPPSHPTRRRSSVTREVRILPRRFRCDGCECRITSSILPSKRSNKSRSTAKTLAEAYAQSTPQKWIGPFVLPVEGTPTSNFGTRSYYNGQPRAPHAGVDFMGEPGTPIRAANHGRIVLAAALYFTGTPSSSITANGCSRCLHTCRRFTRRPATS